MTCDRPVPRLGRWGFLLQHRRLIDGDARRHGTDSARPPHILDLLADLLFVCAVLMHDVRKGFPYRGKVERLTDGRSGDGFGG